MKAIVFGLIGLAAVVALIHDATRPMQCHLGKDWEISGMHWNEYRYCNTPWHTRETETKIRTIY